MNYKSDFQFISKLIEIIILWAIINKLAFISEYNSKHHPFDHLKWTKDALRPKNKVKLNIIPLIMECYLWKIYQPVKDSF